jgi:hypothetical protein
VYGCWSIFSSVIGTIGALIATLTRLVKGFGLVIFVFPRIDHGLLPQEFALMDKGFLIFWSMLIVDHAHTSPIVLSFASILVADVHLRKLLIPVLGSGSDSADARPLPRINRSCLNEITRLPNLNNMVRQRLTFLLLQSVKYHARFASSISLKSSSSSWLPSKDQETLSLALPVSEVLQVKYFRTARRWWLLWLLHQNPSLRAMRKHRLLKEDAILLQLRNRCDSTVSLREQEMNATDKDFTRGEV